MKNLHSGILTMITVATVLLSLTLRADTSGEATALTAYTATEVAQGYTSTTVIVKPRAQSTDEVLDTSVEQALGLTLRKSFDRLGGMRVLELPSGASIPATITALRESGLYDVVSPDHLRNAHVVPTDTQFSSQWSLRNTGTGGSKAGADISATTAWDTRSSAAGVIVAVVDSGAYIAHPDLAANLWTNTGEIAGDGIDNDRNGYIDDVHGINAITNSGSPEDDNGHGTHVAGIIGAIGNNGLGVSGVAWQVQLMPLKFLSSTGTGSLSNGLECINYAIAKGASVINASFGASDSSGYSSAELAAVKAARDAGIIIVCAAGNDGADMDAAPAYPACYPSENVLAVGNSTSLDDVATSSNYGSGSCELFAPGSAILSLGHSGASSLYVSKTGTSMAAPHVSGAIALLKAQFPGDTYRQLINRLLRSTDKVSAFSGKCQTGGRLNLAAALTSTSNRPFNDDFSSAAQLSGTVIAVRGSSTGAGSESGEPSIAGASSTASVWFKWTAPSNSSVTVDTEGSAYDTLLSVSTGTAIDALTTVASNDNASGSVTTSRLSFTASAGVTYSLCVASKTGGTGLLLLNIGSVPANDNFNAPTVLSGLSPLLGDNNSVASTESGEGTINGLQPYKTLWYKWTAPASHRYEFRVTGTAFSPMLSVNTGDSLASLSQEASYTASNGDPVCVFAATEGTSYYLRVASLNSGSGGAFTLSLTDCVWSVVVGEVITNSPAVGPDGTVYVGDGETTLYAVGPTGETRWTRTTTYGMDSSSLSVAADGSIIYPDVSGNVSCVSAANILKWQVNLGAYIHNAPAIAADGTVYIKTDDGILYALSATNGSTLWSYDTSSADSYASPSIGADGTVYVGDANGYLHAVNPSSGLRRWRFAGDAAIYTTPAIASDGGILFATTAGGIYKVNAEGAQAWYRNIGYAVTSAPAISASGAVHFAAYDGKLYSLNGSSGATLWTCTLGTEVRASSPAIASDGTIYVGCYDKRLHAVSSTGTLLRSYATGGILRSSPVIAGSRLYVGSNDKHLYAFDLTSSGSDSSPWPQRSANAARTSRVSADSFPIITAQPDPFPAFLGRTFTLSVGASGTNLSYQWYKNGTAITGATASSYSIASPSASDAGSYYVVVYSGTLWTQSSTVAISVETAIPGRIVNMSARGMLPTNTYTFTLGFVVGYGSTPKPLLIRGLGPTLQTQMTKHTITDPTMTVFNSSSLASGTNDNWIANTEMLAAQSSLTGLNLLSDSKDSAVLSSLSGLNTCEIKDKGGDIGVTLAELYDADVTEGETPATGRLVNVSARNYVGVDQEILVVGFVISGNVPKTLLIRGIGPSLTAQGVTGVLADPTLTLFKGTSQYASNDNWGGTAALTASFAKTQAFSLASDSKDAALLIKLAPGTYTVELRGVGDTTGNGMIEVYEVGD